MEGELRKRYLKKSPKSHHTWDSKNCFKQWTYIVNFWAFATPKLDIFGVWHAAQKINDTNSLDTTRRLTGDFNMRQMLFLKKILSSKTLGGVCQYSDLPFPTRKTQEWIR